MSQQVYHLPSMILVLPLALLLTVQADFTPHFRKFLHDNYGVTLVQELERTDLGGDASLGGKKNDDDLPTKQAVIIVHGITNKVSRFQGMIDFLKKKGYDSNSIYGTTWGDGGRTPVGLVDMKCSYVKQIRSLIIAVRQYTGTQVDVVAYSMGSPIARKAILGGQCVDTREILGPPLTELVDTFLSVAGANYGSSLCIVPIPVGTCNRRSGLHCESTFLQDINQQRRYEGTHVFSVFSTSDDKVGFRSCGRPVSPIVGGTGYVAKTGMNHDQVMDKTLQLQLNFISKHVPV